MKYRGSIPVCGLMVAAALVGTAIASPKPLTLTPARLVVGSDGFPGADALTHPDAAANLSGVATFEVGGRRLAALVTDEGSEVTLVELDPAAKGAAHVFSLGELLAETDLGAPDEVDLEGASYDRGRLGRVGSACLKRKKPDKASRKANVGRLEDVEPVSGGETGAWLTHSNMLYEFSVAWAGASPTLHLERHYDLRRRFGDEKILKRSLAIPSKENGLDVEGVARWGGETYVALRGPVLRGHAVVAVFDATFDAMRLNFLALDGFGIRSIEYFEHPRWGAGFYLVAGPTMDHPGPFTLYKWDGRSDAFMRAGPGLDRVGSFDAPDPSWKAESLFGCGPDLCVAFDGIPGGAPHTLR